jgi:1,4-dihydroxy-2-naphthoate octaprenyltransferase
VDFDSGTDQAVDAADRSPFSGGKRVLVEGLLTRAQTRAVSLVAYLLAVVCGIVIAVAREPAILPLALAGVLLAYFYHGAPVRLSYRGLGELAVGLAYGPMICAGTYLVQAGSVPVPVVLVALPLGLLVAAFLGINEFPDYRADAQAGKHTLVVRLGRRAASRAYAAIVALAFTILALLPLAGLPGTVWLGAVGLLPALRATAILLRYPEDTPRIVPAQGLTLLAFVLYAAGAAAGLLVGR